MAYNGFLADFLFNTGVVAAWCVFLWRVLDGARFRVLGGLAGKYDGSFRHTSEDGVCTVTLSLRAG